MGSSEILNSRRALLDKASELGATDAVVVASEEIRVREQLARVCKDPGCPFYRVSASCPPAVGGPEVFRHWAAECRWAIVVRIDVPASLLFSGARLEIMAQLHVVVSGVERLAHDLGWVKSRGFAGGSCKELFCDTHADCQVLTSSLGCRNPEVSRPSMSGFGVDVGNLMRLAKWPDKQLRTTTQEGDQSMSWLAGVVLIG